MLGNFVDAAAGDSATPCQVRAQNGYIPTLNSISCPDAALIASMTDIAKTCETNPQYYDLPIFGIWICNGTPKRGRLMERRLRELQVLRRQLHDVSVLAEPASMQRPELGTPSTSER